MRGRAAARYLAPPALVAALFQAIVAGALALMLTAIGGTFLFGPLTLVTSAVVLTFGSSS